MWSTVIGIVVVYLAVAWLFAVYVYSSGEDEDDLMVVLAAIFWPVVLVIMGVIYVWDVASPAKVGRKIANYRRRKDRS